MKPRAVAIVGSGPAGFYTAERLIKADPLVRVAILERLPTPFGLVRAGVAPDHQGTKAVTRLFERLLTNERVTFFGNVTVGRDIALPRLRTLFDAVIVATGAPHDRKLGIPDEDGPGVIGSGAFVGWYNGHPDHAGHDLDLTAANAAIVIGNGNVALDVARVLAKDAGEFVRSDLGAGPTAALRRSAIRDIHLCGRRSAAAAKFTPAELDAFALLARAQPLIRTGDLASLDGHPLATSFHALAMTGHEKPVRLHFHFNMTPRRFVRSGDGRLSGVVFETGGNTGGGELTIPAGLAVTCIGYAAAAAPEGYAVGWAASGPTGTIAARRAEAHALADKVLAETAPAGRGGAVALGAILRTAGVRIIDAAAWRRIDEAETARAGPERVREKLTTIGEMLAAAGP